MITSFSIIHSPDNFNIEAVEYYEEGRRSPDDMLYFLDWDFEIDIPMDIEKELTPYIEDFKRRR